MTDKQVGQEKDQFTKTEILRSVKPHSNVAVDFDAYAHFLEGSDLSEAQKRELIESLWSIIFGFVSLGFGVHPMQQIKGGVCGQLEEIEEIAATDTPNPLQYSHQNYLKGSTKLTAHFESVEK